MLRPQDVLVACKLLVIGRVDWTFASLAESLGMSASEVHASTWRGRASGLVTPSGARICRPKLASLLTTSVPDVFFAVRGALARGVPTSTSAPCLADVFPGQREISQVWPWKGDWTGAGKPTRGESLPPIYPSVPEACRRDDRLYRLMALLDVVRAGDDAERKIAADVLKRYVLGDERGDAGRAA